MPSEPRILTIGDHLHLTLAEVHPEVSRFTYPLFAIDERDRPDLYASCVLLECDGIAYIVTAAHAISEITKTGSTVHIGARHIKPLASEFVLSSPCGRDALDIAAMVAPLELLETEEMDVLPQARTTLNRQFDNYHFRCIHGYPCNKNKQKQRLDAVNKSFTRYGFTYAGASRSVQVDYSKFKKDPRSHVVLEYQSKGRDESQQIVAPPHPKGISGGGSWLVPDSSAAIAPYLDGIAIEYHKSRSLVFATRVEHVMTFIRQFVGSQARGSDYRGTGDC